MKPLHAAALLLIVTFSCAKRSNGWYLITPPIEGAVVNKSAPLAKWKIGQSFDSAASCEDNLQASHDEAENLGFILRDKKNRAIGSYRLRAGRHG